MDQVVFIRKPNPFDVHVGARLRACRTLAGLSQEKLGAAVGLSFQQIQKYEKGLNRIGASRLQEFSKLLNVPPSYFFDDMPTNGGVQPLTAISPAAIEAPPEIENISSRMALELVRNFSRIPHADVRHHIFQLVKTAALSFSKETDSEAEAGN